MSKIGVMVCGHGSRDEGAVREFEAVARGIRARLPQYDVESGFLEFATPIIRTGLDELRDKGVTRCLAVPGMLFAAGHAKNDIPSVLNTYQAQHPEMTIDYGRELGIDPKLIQAAAARIEEALDAAGDGVPRHETLLMVVGRGASDPDANSNVAKVMRMLWEGFGFGWGETCYSGVTFPLVEPGLEHAAKLGYKRIVVFPYFLFTGILVKRIYDYADQVAARHPEIEFVKAGYLNDHPAVLDAFAERVQEVIATLRQMLLSLAAEGKAIAAYGAAAKGTMLLNHIGLDRGVIARVADRNPHKQGRNVPGVGIPIVAPEALFADPPDVVLLLPWNLRDEILDVLAPLRARGTRVIVPLPRPEIL